MSTCTASSVQNATALTKERAHEAADACRAYRSSMQDIWHTLATCLHADDSEKQAEMGCRMQECKACKRCSRAGQHRWLRGQRKRWGPALHLGHWLAALHQLDIKACGVEYKWHLTLLHAKHHNPFSIVSPHMRLVRALNHPAWCAELQPQTSALSAETQPHEQPEINFATDEVDERPSGQVLDSQAAPQDRTEAVKGADVEHASEPAVPAQPALLSPGEIESGESKAPAVVHSEASTSAGSAPSSAAHCDTTAAEGPLYPIQAGGSSPTAAPELAHGETSGVMGTELEQPGAGTPAHHGSAETSVPAARGTPGLAHVKTGTLPGIVASRLLESQSSTPLSHRLSDTGSEECDGVTTPPGRPQGNAGSRPGFTASAHDTPR